MSPDYIFPGSSKSPHLHRGLRSHALPTAGPPCPPQTEFFFPPFLCFFLPSVTPSFTIITYYPLHPPSSTTSPNTLNCCTVQHMCFQFAFLLSRVESSQTPAPFWYSHTPTLVHMNMCVHNTSRTFWISANFNTIILVCCTIHCVTGVYIKWIIWPQIMDTVSTGGLGKKGMSTIKNKLSFLCVTPFLMYPSLTQCEEKHVSLVVLLVTTRGAQTTQDSQS